MGNGNKKMRRRSRMKVLKILQSFSQGTFIAFILSLLYCGRSLAEPGYLDFDNLPETNFTCAGKVIGGYYADLEASCQMFHVCTIGQGDEPMDIKFLCLNGTVFDQETRVCERVDEVDCTKSEGFYYLNLELYGNTIIPAPEESSSEEFSSSASSPSSTSTSTTTTTTSTTTTKKPTTTTPSRRFIFNNNKGSSIVSSTTLATPTHSYSTTTSKTPEEEEEYEYDEEEYEDSSKDDSGQNRPVLPTLEDDGSFSPQQFTLQQQTQNSQPKPEDPTKTGSKPAVSFQQQHFQNGGTLAVTNSHVTVTTHTTSSSSSSNGSNSPSTQKKNAQQFLTQKQKHAFEHQQLQQQQVLLQQQMHAKQHQELQKKQQEAAVQQQQKAIQQQQKQVQQHESEIKNHQAQLLLHTQKINRQQQKPAPNKSTYNPYETINPQQEQQSQKSHHQQQHEQQQQQQQSQAPKRIPLLAAVNPLGPPQSQVASQPPSASQLAPFRLKAQGFKLPSQQQQQEDRFEGYRRQPPPQVSLHLPFEQLRHQKDISLQFDPEEEDLTQIPDRKELKRSDPPFHSSIHGNNTPPPATLKTSVFATRPSLTAQPTGRSEPKQPELESVSYPDDPVEYYDEDYSAEPSNGNPRLDSVKSNSNSGTVVAHKRSGEDQLGDPRVHTGSLPATQASRTSSSSGSNSSKSKNTSRFIINNEHHKSPTNPYNSNRSRTGRVYDGRSSVAGGTSAPPKVRASYQPQPKVIVTTSTSIRDNSGRTINYSISSNSSPSTTAASHVASNAKYSEALTRGYDEYKEDDVLSDPFFLDVPKVGSGSGRRKRDASSQRKRRKRFLYIVPRFM
ncbi:transcription factor SPT20 homolog isoform X2 [Ochlerotatus camptorhynchus]|uniref:transcription factor SPT20 homolog isoform X2 n=1 Tax=Ochlerotatus camptorhynchus TaxID=644619 RepID=UPI0031DEA5A7